MLEDEPRYLDASKLTSFKPNGLNAHASILENQAWLRSKDDGLISLEDARVAIGQEEQIEDDATWRDPIWSGNRGELPPRLQRSYHGSSNTDTVSVSTSVEASETHLPPPSEERQDAPEQRSPSGIHPSVMSVPPQAEDFESRAVDLFQPLFDPDMLELFSNRAMLDLARIDTTSLNLDYLDIEGWAQDGISAADVDVSTSVLDPASGENMSMFGWERAA